MLRGMVLVPVSARSVSRSEELAKALEARRQSDAALRKQAAELARSLANQLRGLSDGYSQSITMEIAQLENQLSDVRARPEASDPVTIKRQMRDTGRFAESLRDSGALWRGEPQIAREEIAKHMQKITLKPVLRTYIASGVWDWLGVLGGTPTMVVPGE